MVERVHLRFGQNGRLPIAAPISPDSYCRAASTGCSARRRRYCARTRSRFVYARQSALIQPARLRSSAAPGTGRAEPGCSGREGNSPWEPQPQSSARFRRWSFVRCGQSTRHAQSSFDSGAARKRATRAGGRDRYHAPRARASSRSNSAKRVAAFIGGAQRNHRLRAAAQRIAWAPAAPWFGAAKVARRGKRGPRGVSPAPRPAPDPSSPGKIGIYGRCRAGAAEGVPCNPQSALLRVPYHRACRGVGDSDPMNNGGRR